MDIFGGVQFKFGPLTKICLFLLYLNTLKLVKCTVVHEGGGLFKSGALFAPIRYFKNMTSSVVKVAEIYRVVGRNLYSFTP